MLFFLSDLMKFRHRSGDDCMFILDDSVKLKIMFSHDFVHSMPNVL